MLPLTFLLLRQLQPLLYKARATTAKTLGCSFPSWDVPCSLAIFAPCGKAEKSAKAQSPSSSEKMHIYTKQALYSLHCSSVTLSVKKKKLIAESRSGPPAIHAQMGFSSLPCQWLSLGLSCRTSTLPPISLSGLAPLLPGVPELAPPFFSQNFSRYILIPPASDRECSPQALPNTTPIQPSPACTLKAESSLLLSFLCCTQILSTT